MNAQELIESAMEGVRIVVCPRCAGLGALGRGDFQCPCVECRGCGEITVNVLTGARWVADEQH